MYLYKKCMYLCVCICFGCVSIFRRSPLLSWDCRDWWCTQSRRSQRWSWPQRGVVVLLVFVFFLMYFLLFFVCLLRTFFCLQRISQLATNARARGDRCAPQDPNMYLYTCICTCFMYLHVFVSRTLVSRWPAGKRASNYKWATGATKLLLLAAPFVRNFTPKKARS